MEEMYSSDFQRFRCPLLLQKNDVLIPFDPTSGFPHLTWLEYRNGLSWQGFIRPYSTLLAELRLIQNPKKLFLEKALHVTAQ